MNQPVHHQQFASRLNRTGPVAVLDIGTSKIACIVAYPVAEQGSALMQIKGVGTYASKGFRAGMVTDMEAAEKSIRAAVEAAERMAETTIENVLVGISSTALQSQTYNVTEPLNGYAVDDEILASALLQARDKCASEQVELLHAIPVSYKIDNGPNVQDPRGMHGDMLRVTTHVMTAPITPVRNLLLCIEKSHLTVDRLIATPYASALSCLVEDEADLGATVIDLGAGTTGFTVFFEGAPIYTAILPIGAHNITTDIAQILNIPVEQAERLKMMHGSAWSDSTALHENVNILPIGENDPSQIQAIDRAQLTQIIRPRLEETFELVREKIESSAISQFVGRRVILTGGGAQLTGVEDLATQILEKQVRRGRPMRMAGLPEAVSGPAFAASTGLVTYAYKRPNDYLYQTSNNAGFWGRFGQLGNWFKRNF